VSAPDSSCIDTSLHVFTPSEESAIHHHVLCIIHYSYCTIAVLPVFCPQSIVALEGEGSGGHSVFAKQELGHCVIKKYVITSTCYLHYLCCDVYKKTNIAAAADVLCLCTLFIRCVQRTRTKNLRSCSYLFIHIHIMLCKYPKRLEKYWFDYRM